MSPVMLRLIEHAGRTCYKSEKRITDDSAFEFVRKIIQTGHHSVLEHVNITVKFVTDRGVTHELVRHRLASYSQESTRYCNYGGGLTFIIPVWMNIEPGEYVSGYLDTKRNDELYWLQSMLDAERYYRSMLISGATPQEARQVLPNSTKTEIIMTANLREWMHVLNLRTSVAAHPQIASLMTRLNNELFHKLPEVFHWVQPVNFAELRNKTLIT